MNELFKGITNRISNYLQSNNITTNYIYYERKNNNIILGIKVSKGDINDLNNYVLFKYNLSNNNLDIQNDKKNNRTALILVRYLSEEIVMFFLDMEQKINELDNSNYYFFERDYKIDNKKELTSHM